MSKNCSTFASLLIAEHFVVLEKKPALWRKIGCKVTTKNPNVQIKREKYL